MISKHKGSGWRNLTNNGPPGEQYSLAAAVAALGTDSDLIASQHH
jgi:hypothetical protein